MNRLLPLYLTFGILVGTLAVVHHVSAAPADFVILVTCESDRTLGWVPATGIVSSAGDAGFGIVGESCADFLQILLDSTNEAHQLADCEIVASTEVRSNLVYTLQCAPKPES